MPRKLKLEEETMAAALLAEFLKHQWPGPVLVVLAPFCCCAEQLKMNCVATISHGLSMSIIHL